MQMRAKWMLLVVVCFTMLLGCAKSQTTETSTSANKEPETAQTTPAAEEPIELQFYYPIAVGGPLTKVIEDMTAKFTQKHPNIKVNSVYTGSYADTTTKIQAGIQAQQPPDVAVMLSTELFSMLDTNAVIPLDDFIAKDSSFNKEDIYPAFMANSQVEGKTYSIPFQRSTIVLYYNKAAFKEAGLDPEKPPTTWEELTQYASKLKKDGRQGIEIPGSGFAYWMFQLFSLQNAKDVNQNLMSEDGKKAFFNTPENVEALQYWVDLSKKHKVMPEGVIEWATVPTDFIEGKTAMMIHTTGNLTNVKNNAKFDFGVAFLPMSKQYGSPTGGGNFYIFKDIDPKKQAAAWEFVKFMTEPEMAAQWSIDTGYVGVRKSAYETELMKKYAAEFPQALVARDQLQHAHAELSTHNNGKVSKALTDQIQAALTGTTDPATALKKAQEDADKALAPFNK
ncbi:ABC transporter substrate-binding protein [Paenibacillus taiwanensis]|uniref:ABC transporter substrate-binding protein n=1 Tax=Paenibacillus taiwanensis TaxID=401638 RepID=UPI000415A132|nr:ABC transporter substrate-binding protein [Paenibacillus taiwanensis]